VAERETPCNEKLPHLYFSPIFNQVIKSRMRWAGMLNAWLRTEMHAGFWWGNVKDRNHLEDLDVYGKDNINMDF
jgi:hypothetical protein